MYSPFIWSWLYCPLLNVLCLDEAEGFLSAGRAQRWCPDCSGMLPFLIVLPSLLGQELPFTSRARGLISLSVLLSSHLYKEANIASSRAPVHFNLWQWAVPLITRNHSCHCFCEWCNGVVPSCHWELHSWGFFVLLVLVLAIPVLPWRAPLSRLWQSWLSFSVYCQSQTFPPGFLQNCHLYIVWAK